VDADVEGESLMPIIQRVVYKFRCDRCGNHATFGDDDAFATPPFHEQVETLEDDGWKIVFTHDVYLLNLDGTQVTCPLHVDLEESDQPPSVEVPGEGPLWTL
jgi:hypothetical protein